MSSKIIVPAGSDLFISLDRAARERKLLFLAGIPGVGKSLYVQQLLLLAQAAGRTVHLFQYDGVRTAFEHHPPLALKYPEESGVTHPMIRKGVGVWARQALVDWVDRFAADEHILIGEVPLIGNRLIELVQPAADDAESLLSGPATLFMIPVPSQRIRQKIVAKRQETIANPRHEKERMDAQISVLRQVWAEAHSVAVKLGLAEPLENGSTPIPYDPDVYAAVYEHLCRHRQTETLRIDLDLEPSSSVYEWAILPQELRATSAAAELIIEELEKRYDGHQIADLVKKWAD